MVIYGNLIVISQFYFLAVWHFKCIEILFLVCVGAEYFSQRKIKWAVWGMFFFSVLFSLTFSEVNRNIHKVALGSPFAIFVLVLRSTFHTICFEINNFGFLAHTKNVLWVSLWVPGRRGLTCDFPAMLRMCLSLLNHLVDGSLKRFSVICQNRFFFSILNYKLDLSSNFLELGYKFLVQWFQHKTFFF
jgi:hypothetical protein